MVLLFFEFFISLGTAVNASAIVKVINHDPSVTGSHAGGLVILPALGVLVYAGLFYLLKDKLHRKKRMTSRKRFES